LGPWGEITEVGIWEQSNKSFEVRPIRFEYGVKRNSPSDMGFDLTALSSQNEVLLARAAEGERFLALRRESTCPLQKRPSEGFYVEGAKQRACSDRKT